MKELEKEEMLKVEGGANGLLIAGIVSAAVAAVVTFVTGLLHGYSNPKECNIEVKS